MNELVRYWNQNRGKIIITIAIIAFVIIIIQAINNMLKNRMQTNVSTITDPTQPVQSVITGEKVSVEKTEENTDFIEEFVQNCNDKEYDKAFSLLTEECKNEFNNDINNFINNYCNKIFTTTKIYNLELWLHNGKLYTYRVKFYEDNLLATGSSSMDNNIEDYITVTNQNDESRISVNGLIVEKEIEKSQTVNDIQIMINSSKVYKNYEKYSITIRNGSNKTILISANQDNGDICLMDENDVEYKSFLNEIPMDNLILKPGEEKSISINFNKIYDLYRIIEKIKFSNIILDGEKYMESPNESNLEKIEVIIDV